MPKSKPVQKYKELTEDELEMIHWRATRGCHFDGGFLYASEYGKEVIQNDVPLLIAEIRRLRGILTQLDPMYEFQGGLYCFFCKEYEKDKEGEVIHSKDCLWLSAQHSVHPTGGGHACPDCGFPSGKNVTHACVPIPTTSG